MVVKIVGEHNFFLFQDIVLDFKYAFVEGWRFPIVNKYRPKDYAFRSTNEYIYDSWFEVFKSKLLSSPKTDYLKKLLESFSSWMITTNIAITTAQIKRGRDGIPSWERESVNKYKPSFLIELGDDLETYIVHLEDDILTLFNESIYFFEQFQILEPSSLMTLLKRYFVFEDEYLKKEIDVICEHFKPNDTYSKYKQTYEVIG